MNELDAALQAVMPAVVAPRYEGLTEIAGTAQRYVLTRDGVMLEVRRPWFHGRWLCHKKLVIPMPYGVLDSKVELLCGPLPRNLLDEFERQCRRWAPLEHAAWLTWNEHTGQWRLVELEVTQRSASSLCYRRPCLEEGEHMVLDVHSHGDGRAFFSQTDDSDDYGAVKIAGVLGRCRSERPEWKFRVMALGRIPDITPVL